MGSSRHGDSGRRHESSRHHASGPRHDSSNRVSKSSSSRADDSKSRSRYMTEEEQSRQFIAGEDKFVLTQSKKKADIRVREDRAEPIDFIAFSLRYIDEERDLLDEQQSDKLIKVPAPESVIESLDLDGIRKLLKELESYRTLETNKRNRQYWDAIKTLSKDTESKLDPRKYGHRMTANVEEDIDRLLKPKNLAQLEELEKVVKDKLDNDDSIDYDYWTDLLKRLRVWKAKGVLGQVQAAVDKLRQEQAAAAPSVQQPSLQQHNITESSRFAAASGSGAPHQDVSHATNALYDREAARGIAENEEVFAAEEEVGDSSKPQWGAKYEARKPRYFNRVQMGYDWNKYNQTHYDQDNPPPKVVQGYKFNIFYPDLVDVTKAPTYKIIREHGRRRGESHAAAGEDDTCLIRFIAGPPYQDIAFRIVDREWDYSAKRDRGFKSSFDKGILQLHFQFKKIYYRK